ncbi:hypothetical protein GGS20DRAFT_537304 [Poronia punctata]|nr:hypothetical protein GGS20DRAFT_537304 [Poronia punctata]
MSTVSHILNGHPPPPPPGLPANRMEQLNYYRHMDEQRNNLIQDMMQKIEEDANTIANLQLDLDDQKKSRAQYQSRALAFENEISRWTQKLNTGSFVVVLIDGDGAKFREEFLRDHEQGAARAAWKLKEAVKNANGGHDIPIIVRVYANVNDLARSLRLSGVTDQDDSLRLFAQNFTNTTADFDFINVGKGKENTDSKIRRLLNHYHKNVQCQKIFIACCHDNGYLHDLRHYAGEVDNKIVLVETTPAEPGFRSLEFPILRFDSVFRSEPLGNEFKRGAQFLSYTSPSSAHITAGPIGRAIQATYGHSETASLEVQEQKPPTPSASPAAASPVLNTTTTTTTTPTATAVNVAAAATTAAKAINNRLQPAPSPQSKAPAQSPTTGRSSAVVNSGNGGVSVSYATAGGATEHQNVTVKAAKSKKQPKFALYNADQHRLDPPTQHPPRTPAQTTYQTKFQSIKPLVFCNDHYLKGRCKRGVNCDKEHEMELSPAELAIHRYKARTSLCPSGPYCTDYDCYLSHHCPRPNCGRSDECPFYHTEKFGDLHYSKEELIPKSKWYEGSDFPCTP